LRAQHQTQQTRLAGQQLGGLAADCLDLKVRCQPATAAAGQLLSAAAAHLNGVHCDLRQELFALAATSKQGHCPFDEMCAPLFRCVELDLA